MRITYTLDIHVIPIAAVSFAGDTLFVIYDIVVGYFCCRICCILAHAKKNEPKRYSSYIIKIKDVEGS